ncbi:MAG TPA: glycosyltransferase, partial [Candidatus Saccharimonadia bacterium]|nr:glycosyltransferase [Candidatus Saccharimonadia bacterium]
MQRPVRIAFVTDAVYPYNLGGKERRLHEISTRLAKSGHDVHIYTMNWWDGGHTIRQDGVTLHAISRLHPLYKGGRRSIGEALWFGLATLKMAFARFDVIDVDSMPFFPLFSARLVCWLRHKPLIATWHEVTDRATWQAYLGPTSGRMASLIEHAASAMPNLIVSNSVHTTSRLHKTGVRAAVITVPLGVNLGAIEAAPSAQAGSDVLFVGRLLSHKNADLVVRAIGMLKASRPTISCTIVGDGPERPQIEALITELGLQDNVRLLPGVDRDTELYGLMKAAKVFALPSVREGFGLAAVEANAAGLPVVTSSHSDNATRDLIEEGVNGLTVAPNAKDLAKGLETVLSNPKKFQPKANIAGYDWNQVVSQLTKAYRTPTIKPLTVTTSWDDGHVLDLKLAALLKRHHLAGTFYVSPQDREFMAADRLTPDQVRELADDFEIGAHTVTHPRLTQVPLAEAEAEIRESKHQLERMVGKPITTFCYPGGAYNADHVRITQAAGYSYARTTDRFAFSGGARPFETPTTVHAYRHWSDVFKIVRFARFNPLAALDYLLNWDHLAMAMFDRAQSRGGVFHLWGHSWEIDANHDWTRLERVLT